MVIVRPVVMRYSASVVCNSPKLDTILFVFRWAIPSWLALEKRAWRWTSLSSSETQRRSVGLGKTKTGATKVFKHRRKRPWVPTLTGPFPNGQANAVSWLGTKNALYYCAQSANSFSWVLFVSSYTTAIFSPATVARFVYQAFLTRNEETINESKNVSDAIIRSNSTCTEKILFLTDHNVS